MSSSLLPGLAALIGTLAGVAATYLVASRKSSGRIRTSEAEVLWEASESIRHDLTAEVAQLRGEVAALKSEIGQLRARLEASRDA